MHPAISDAARLLIEKACVQPMCLALDRSICLRKRMDGGTSPCRLPLQLH
jgi:hypothetical protein